jgi:hypothetical protein
MIETFLVTIELQILLVKTQRHEVKQSHTLRLRVFARLFLKPISNINPKSPTHSDNYNNPFLYF